MEKKKINQEDLHLNPTYSNGKVQSNEISVTNQNGGNERDHPTPSETIEGEGTTCVTNVCPESVNCIPTISVGPVCVPLTNLTCQQSVDNCATQATCKVSVCICPATDDCQTENGDPCQISIGIDCIHTKGHDCD